MKLPAFAEYTPDRYRKEIAEGMAAQLERLAALRDDPEPATIANVLEAWEAARAPLNLTLSVFYSVRSAETTDGLDAVAEEVAPKLAAHDDAITLDRGLYDRLKALQSRIDSGEVAADEQDQWHLGELIRDAERAGVALPEAEQSRLRELNERLAALSTQFERLNREARNAAAVTADDGTVIPLVNTTQQPAAATIADAGLRRRILDASLNRALGEFDTRDTLVEMARLRAERATLLGYPSHAALVIAQGTAKTTDAVEDVLIPLAQAALEQAGAEAVELARKYAELEPGAEFTAADWQFVANAVRRERFDFDEADLAEYLTVDKVVQATLDAATDLYGITFTRRDDLAGLTRESDVYQVDEADGTPLGLFLFDPWARPSKNGGAWMTQILEQSELSDTLPVVTNNCNYSQSSPSISWDDVITMFHEFGHALHGLFGKAKYPSRSGTAVPRDFVEFPSQVNEQWAWEPGRVLPAEWLDRLKAASRFGLGYDKAEALIAAVLDYVWHSTPLDELPTSADEVADFEADALEGYGLADELVPPRYRTQYFAHIWGGGYAASYYGYTWAEVLDADAVAWFEEQGGGTRANGDHFRATLLGRGGGYDPMDTWRLFRGRDPELQPLLDRLGLSLKA